MTDVSHAQNMLPGEYPTAFLNILSNPKRLWDIAFRTHIPEKCRHLLYTLFFGSEYGEKVIDLRLIYDSLHAFLSRKYGYSHDPKDFEDALRILEGGFISIANGMVSFVNPSVRDYLKDYLDDLAQLEDFARSAQRAGWALSLWRHGCDKIGDEFHSQFAAAFGSLAKKFYHLPLWKPSGEHSGFFSEPSDLPNTRRIEFLMELWKASQDVDFARIATDLSANPKGGFNAWRDGTNLVELIASIKDDGLTAFPFFEEIIDGLEGGLIKLLGGGLASDDLASISDEIEERREQMISEVHQAVAEAIKCEFDNLNESISDTESSSTLEDQRSALERLAPRAGIEAQRLAAAIEAVDERILVVQAQKSSNDAEVPGLDKPEAPEDDQFDDRALVNLFRPLTYRTPDA